MADEMKLTGVLESVDAQGDDAHISFGEVVDGLGARGYGPLLIAVCIIELLPTGAIPGVPTLVGLMVILIASQLLLGRRSPWVPEWLRRKNLDRKKFEKGKEKVKPFTEKIDRVIQPRLEGVTGATGEKVAAAVCIVLALTFMPLELIPFASSVPSSIIVLIGLGLSAKDGALLAGAYLAVAVAAVVASGLLVF